MVNSLYLWSFWFLSPQACPAFNRFTNGPEHEVLKKMKFHTLNVKPVIRMLPAIGLLIMAGCASGPTALARPFSGDQFIKCPPENQGVESCELRPEYERRVRRIKGPEAALAVKGGPFSNNLKLPANTKYYEIGRFEVNGYVYKLIAFDSLFEGSSPILSFRLISYDSKGRPLDTLFLEERFAYEDIERFEEFRIDQDEVFIDHYLTRVISFDEDGNMAESIENPVPQLYRKVRYKMTNGYFNLISRTDMPGVID